MDWVETPHDNGANPVQFKKRPIDYDLTCPHMLQHHMLAILAGYEQQVLLRLSLTFKSLSEPLFCPPPLCLRLLTADFSSDFSNVNPKHFCGFCVSVCLFLYVSFLTAPGLGFFWGCVQSWTFSCVCLCKEGGGDHACL